MSKKLAELLEKLNKHEERIKALEKRNLELKIKREAMICPHCKKQMVLALVCPRSEIIQAAEHTGIICLV